jgi:septation ring formation regulator EzrA
MSEEETQVDPIEEIEDNMREHGEKAVKLLEDMRSLARTVGKHVSHAGVPDEFQRRATQLIVDIEDIESNLSEYVVEVER